MIPTIAIVGRPNVGKSTLFNVLTRTRDALVADEAGLTRDRKFGRGRVGESDYIVIDTGGLSDDENIIAERITEQALLAVDEADCVLFLVDGRDGLTPIDESIAERLRTTNTPIHLVANKTEGLNIDLVSAEFYQLGFPTVHGISSSHRRGVESLMNKVLADIPEPEEESETILPENFKDSIKVAIIGRPNVGKSTLVNRMLGYERVVAFDLPGTTRDSIFIPFEKDGQAYTIIDTAGVRRRAKVSETIEKFSVVKSLKAIEAANVVIMLLDATEGMTDQDANLLGTILDRGCALMIVMNKWDGLSKDQRDAVKRTLDHKLHFIDYAKVEFISALHGSNVGLLFGSIKKAWDSAFYKAPTSFLNKVFSTAVEQHEPPSSHGRRIKPRFIHQSGQNPPTFTVHGNQVDKLPNSYKRYLMNYLRESFKLEGTPVRLEFKQTNNPFQGRKNKLTASQINKRQRMMRFIKKR